MTKKKIMINGKQVMHYKRECVKCGSVDWLRYNSTSAIAVSMCKSCQKMFKGSVPIGTKQKELPQDEDANQKMIQEWLRNNKPSVRIN